MLVTIEFGAIGSIGENSNSIFDPSTNIGKVTSFILQS
jgi:hypothetical protein